MKSERQKQVEFLKKILKETEERNYEELKKLKIKEKIQKEGVKNGS